MAEQLWDVEMNNGTIHQVRAFDEAAAMDAAELITTENGYPKNEKGDFAAWPIEANLAVDTGSMPDGGTN